MNEFSELDFPSVLEEIIKKKFLDFHACLPGKITEIDRSKQKCNVQPLILKPLFDDDPIKLPIITNVPINYTKGQKGHLYIPLYVGDYVTLYFTDYSLDNWLVQGGDNIDPQDERTHQLSDCVAYPGLIDFQHPIELDNPDNAYFKHGSMTIELDPSGKIKIQGATDEIVQVLIDTVQAVINAKVKVDVIVSNAVPLVPGPVTGEQAEAPLTSGTIAALNALKSKLQGLKI